MVGGDDDQIIVRCGGTILSSAGSRQQGRRSIGRDRYRGSTFPQPHIFLAWLPARMHFPVVYLAAVRPRRSALTVIELLVWPAPRSDYAPSQKPLLESVLPQPHIFLACEPAGGSLQIRRAAVPHHVTCLRECASAAPSQLPAGSSVFPHPHLPAAAALVATVARPAQEE